MNIIYPAFVSFAVGLAALSHGADKPDHQLSEWKVGPVLFGEKVSDSDMKGKVVVIEHWGVRCPPCIALLPHLAKLDKRHREDGLLLIGAESQNHSKDQIEPLVEKNKIEYTITSGASGPVKFSGIPHAFVFDAGGRLVFSGNPGGGDFERTIKKALKDAVRKDEGNVAVTANLFETRMWTNSDGKQIKAGVKNATEDDVTFVMFGGKVVTYPMVKLSEESRKIITEALAAREKN